MPRINAKMVALTPEHVKIIRFVGYDKVAQLTQLSRSYLRMLCAKKPKYTKDRRMQAKHWELINNENKEMHKLSYGR